MLVIGWPHVMLSTILLANATSENVDTLALSNVSTSNTSAPPASSVTNDFKSNTTNRKLPSRSIPSEDNMKIRDKLIHRIPLLFSTAVSSTTSSIFYATVTKKVTTPATNSDELITANSPITETLNSVDLVQTTTTATLPKLTPALKYVTENATMPNKNAIFHAPNDVSSSAADITRYSNGLTPHLMHLLYASQQTKENVPNELANKFQNRLEVPKLQIKALFPRIDEIIAKNEILENEKSDKIFSNFVNNAQIGSNLTREKDRITNVLNKSSSIPPIFSKPSPSNEVRNVALEMTSKKFSSANPTGTPMYSKTLHSRKASARHPSRAENNDPLSAINTEFPIQYTLPPIVSVYEPFQAQYFDGQADRDTVAAVPIQKLKYLKSPYVVNPTLTEDIKLPITLLNLVPQPEPKRKSINYSPNSDPRYSNNDVSIIANKFLNRRVLRDCCCGNKKSCQQPQTQQNSYTYFPGAGTSAEAFRAAQTISIPPQIALQLGSHQPFLQRQFRPTVPRCLDEMPVVNGCGSRLETNKAREAELTDDTIIQLPDGLGTISERDVDDFVDKVIFRGKIQKPSSWDYGPRNSGSTTHDSTISKSFYLGAKKSGPGVYGVNDDAYGSGLATNRIDGRSSVYEFPERSGNGGFYGPTEKFFAVEHPFSNKFFVEQSLAGRHIRGRESNCPQGGIFYSPPQFDMPKTQYIDKDPLTEFIESLKTTNSWNLLKSEGSVK